MMVKGEVNDGGNKVSAFRLKKKRNEKFISPL